DLKHRAIVGLAPKQGRTEQVADGVGDYAAGWEGAVGAVEAGHGDGGTGITYFGLRDLEHRTVHAEAAGPLCGAEQVVVGVRDEATVGEDAIGAVKADQNPQNRRHRSFSIVARNASLLSIAKDNSRQTIREGVMTRAVPRLTLSWMN